MPCPATLWKRPDIGRRFLRFDFKDLPDRTYLLVGDFAHNLRASLDYVVYTLIVKATGNPPASTGIQWPVQKTKDDGNFKRQTKDVPQLAADLIETFQPYHDGVKFKEHWLWQVHKLDIIDKHRRIAINQQAFDMCCPTFSPKAGHLVVKGDRFIEFSYPIEVPPVEVLYNDRPVIEFGASEEDLFLKVERLEELYRIVVADVMPKFGQFF